MIEKQSLGFNDITDGLSNTLFAVELPEAPEIWTKPDNLTLKEVCEILKKRPSSQPVIMGFLDGSVLQFRSYVGDANLKAFCSRAGNDIVSPKSLGGFFSILSSQQRLTAANGYGAAVASSMDSGATIARSALCCGNALKTPATDGNPVQQSAFS